MSHRPERKEKDCLNCGTRVLGRYCQKCGQENLEPKESFWGMVFHFIEDITHFDGKFFTTLRVLITKPGFLSAEYMKGKRMSYLNPVRMYVFTSAFFFLVFFSITNTEKAFRLSDDDPYTAFERDSVITELREDLAKNPADSDYLNQLRLLKDTTREVRPSDLWPFRNVSIIGTIGGDYRSAKEYDSIQRSMPVETKDGWLKRIWNQRALKLNDKYRSTGYKQGMRDMATVFLHKLPYLLFVSLPFFALILKLLYIRRRQYYYADHGIFSIHHYIFSFILLLFIFLIGELQDLSGWGIWDFLQFLIFIAWPVYLFIAMRRFYKQGFFKTFVKFLLLNILGLFVLLILFVAFGLFSAFQL